MATSWSPSKVGGNVNLSLKMYFMTLVEYAQCSIPLAFNAAKFITFTLYYKH